GGREFRVLVDAESVDDEKAIQLARKIGQKLAQLQLQSPFPGQMKITLIREKRVVEIAK
ncbi:MAG: ribonuclease Y, partial [Planctomycetes bacterium]|nr:ribonuclease Y [Planctomycetota bacterium]